MDRVLLLFFNTSSKLPRVLHCGRFDMCVRFCSASSSLLPAQACTRHRQPPCSPRNPMEMLRSPGLGISRATTRTNVTWLRLRTHIIAPRQEFAHKYQSRLCALFNSLTIRIYLALPVNRNARVLLSFLWPHSVPFGRLHRSLYVRLCDRDFLVSRAIWCMVSCCVRLVEGTWRAFLLWVMLGEARVVYDVVL